MFSLKKMGQGSEEYYLDLPQYYLGDGPGDDEGLPLSRAVEGRGIWLGRGAEALGLAGVVDGADLRQLMQGVHPRTGAALVQNALSSSRCPGWDGTFSAPKPVSLLWSAAPEPVRHQIAQMHDAAVEETLRWAEDFVAVSRTGHGGTGSVSVGLVVAAFQHATSRALDQQLHTHCLVLNVGIDAQGFSRALDTRPLYHNKLLLGAYYRAALAHRLSQVLTSPLVNESTGFSIPGIPDSLIEAASTRRQEILQWLDERGRSGAISAAAAALATRQAKEGKPSEELFQFWQARNAEHGFSWSQFAGTWSVDRAEALPASQPLTDETALVILRDSISALALRQPHFTKTELFTAVLAAAPAWGVEPAGLLQSVARLIDRRREPSLVSLGRHQGESRFTTKAVLDQENQLLEAFGQLRQAPGAYVETPLVKQAIQQQLASLARAKQRKEGANAAAPQLSDEQLAAIQHLTQDTLGSGAVRLIRGLAGTGKTKFVLQIANTAWRAAGYRPLAATPTAMAGQVLAAEADLETATIHKRLGDYQIPTLQKLGHHLRQLKRAAQGKPTYRLKTPAPVRLDARSILVIDESGMVNTRHTQMLMQQVADAGGTIVMVGDPAQLPPVAGGAPFQSLAARAGAISLVNIQRQQEAWAREVAKHASRGEVPQALALLAEHRAVQVAETSEAAMQALVEAWSRQGLTRPQEAIVLANTNRETEQLNQQIQAARQAAGYLSARLSLPIRDVTSAGIVYENRVSTGDRVLFTKNDARIGVDNGSLGTVMAVRPLRRTLSVLLDSGQAVLLSAADYPHLRLGYAVTTYKAQGQTYPQAYVLATEANQSLPTFYVQVTRAVENTTIFTTTSLWDPNEQPIAASPLAHSLARAPDLRLASDLLAPPTTTTDLPELPLPSWEVNPTSQPTLPAAWKANWLAPEQAIVTSVGPQQQPPLAAAPAISSAWSTATLPPPDSAPTRAASVPPLRRKRRRPSPPAEPLQLPGAPQPLRPTRRKRKRRRGQRDDFPAEDKNTRAASPTPVDVAPPTPDPEPPTAPPAELEMPADTALLPAEFLETPIPQLADWDPAVPLDSGGPLLPEEFCRTVLPPTLYRIPSRAQAKILKPKSPRSNTVTPEQWAQPALRAKLVREARGESVQEIIQSAGVPPDQVEIISIEQWEEEGERMITIWTRITFRIRTYRPSQLLATVGFPVLIC